MNRKREIERELDKLKVHKYGQKRNTLLTVKKNTNFFLSLEKKHQVNNTIREIKTGQGKVCENGDILNAMCDFYSQFV